MNEIKSLPTSEQQKKLDKLFFYIQNAKDGLAIVEINSPALRREIIFSLTKSCEFQGINPLALKLEPGKGGFTGQIEAGIDSCELPPQVVFLCNLEAFVAKLSDDESKNYIRGLNFSREFFMTVRLVTVLFLSTHLVKLFRRYAPDFWDWRGVMLHFESAVESRAKMEPASADSGLWEDVGTRQRLIEILEGQLESARAAGQSSREIYKNILFPLSSLYYRNFQWEKSISLLQEVITSALERKDRVCEGDALGNLGLAYAALGQLDKAIDYSEQVLVISREIGNHRSEGLGWGNLGAAYGALGQLEQAIDCFERSLVISREIGDRRGEGGALGNQGNAYSVLGQLDKAIDYLEQALVISREIGDRRGEGTRLVNLGAAYSDLGQLDKAIDYSEQALVIQREIGDRRGEGNGLRNLGLAYSDLGQLDKAIEYLQRCLTIAEEIQDPRMKELALSNLKEIRERE